MKTNAFLTLLVFTLCIIPCVRAQYEPEEEEELIFAVVDVEAEFPGGYRELYRFLAQNVNYPDSAKTHDIEGTVVVSFAIDTSGNVCDARIVSDIGGGCGEEVLRVVKMMPQWKPAQVRRKKVRSRYNLPFSFALTKEKD